MFHACIVGFEPLDTGFERLWKGTSRNSDFRDEVQGARSAATGTYFRYVRIASTAQRSNSPEK